MNKIEKLQKVYECIDVAKSMITYEEEAIETFDLLPWRTVEIKDKYKKNIVNHELAIKKLQRYGAKLAYEIFEGFPFWAQNQALKPDRVYKSEEKKRPFQSIDSNGSYY